VCGGGTGEVLAQVRHAPVSPAWASQKAEDAACRAASGHTVKALHREGGHGGLWIPSRVVHVLAELLPPQSARQDVVKVFDNMLQSDVPSV
jgi:hypothetical protein